MTSFFCCSRCQSLRQALILWASVRHSAANAEDLREAGSIPGLGRSPGGRYGSSLQYCLENALDEGAWQALVHRAAERSDTTEAAYHAAQRRLTLLRLGGPPDTSVQARRRALCRVGFWSQAPPRSLRLWERRCSFDPPRALPSPRFFCKACNTWYHMSRVLTFHAWSWLSWRTECAFNRSPCRPDWSSASIPIDDNQRTSVSLWESRWTCSWWLYIIVVW